MNEQFNSEIEGKSLDELRRLQVENDRLKALLTEHGIPWEQEVSEVDAKPKLHRSRSPKHQRSNSHQQIKSFSFAVCSMVALTSILFDGNRSRVSLVTPPPAATSGNPESATKSVSLVETVTSVCYCQ